ncbi:MAG: O-antigen ligase family protein, partial [Chloroflexota bacterium]
AIIFYITPWLPVYLLALIVLFVLIYHRPILGLVLITFSIPFYVPQLLKPIYVYRFSPVEIFTLLTFGAVLLRNFGGQLEKIAAGEVKLNFKPNIVDFAILGLLIVSVVSLAFTERLDVATNELRTVIIGPILFYWMLRITKLDAKSIKWLIWAFIAGGLLVALIGLGQYVLGSNLITAEQGLQRLRSIYGSPNNVALYLGRLYPILLAITLAYFWDGTFKAKALLQAWKPLVLLLIILITILLTFSRGGLLLGIPAATAIVWFAFLRKQKWPIWPWVTVGILVIVAGYFAALQIPSLAGRLSLNSQTAGFRINLWASSLQIIQDHPLTGLGLDNFLYAYRNEYILARAWQEPNLNHPHNHILDFATRLGLPGLLLAILIFWETLKQLFTKIKSAVSKVEWAFWIGLAGSITYILAHGLVDHTFFLVDLAYSTLLLVALSMQNLIPEQPIL